MLERDPRWENVTARVGTPFGWVDDGSENGADWKNHVEFLMEVRLGGDVLYSRGYISKRELEDAKLNIYNRTLDKMVHHLDKHMDKLGELS